MCALDRTARPLPTTLATLAALLAIVAAASALPRGPGPERGRIWTLRPLDGQDDDLRAAMQLTTCLARAARDLLGAVPPCAAVIAPLHSAPLIPPQATGHAPRPEAPPTPRAHVVVAHLALPPPLA